MWPFKKKRKDKVYKLREFTAFYNYKKWKILWRGIPKGCKIEKVLLEDKKGQRQWVDSALIERVYT